MTWILAILVVLLGAGAFSGARSWTHVFAVSLDILTVSMFTRRYGVTISSWCGVQMAVTNGNKVGRWLGGLLNRIQKNHTTLAMQADMERSWLAFTYLKLADNGSGNSANNNQSSANLPPAATDNVNANH